MATMGVEGLYWL